jgi:Cu-processing system permease protein
MFKVFQYSFFDLIRSRWSIIYALFFLLVTSGLLYMSADVSRVIVSLLNIVLFIIPLVSLVLGTIYYYNSREFTELLLAHPIPRRSVFMGQFLGLTTSLGLAFLLGLGLPFAIFGANMGAFVSQFGILMVSGLLLTFVFCGIAYLIAVHNDNRLKGLGLSIMIWLLTAVIYDGIFLLALVLFQEYPLDSFTLGATMFNPIDLARILTMLKLDISALMGYTGAVFNKFFGTNQGILISLGVLILWVVAPVVWFMRYALKKDF